MIINIPLQIDEAVFEGKIQQNYDKIVTDTIAEKVLEVLGNYSDSGWKKDSKDGVRYLVRQKIEDDIESYKNEIIEAASEKLAERLVRTKKAKEMLNEKLEEL